MNIIKQIIEESKKEGDVVILNKNEALGLYLNLVDNWINRDWLYEETEMALTKIRDTYNL